MMTLSNSLSKTLWSKGGIIIKKQEYKSWVLQVNFNFSFELLAIYGMQLKGFRSWKYSIYSIGNMLQNGAPYYQNWQVKKVSYIYLILILRTQNLINRDEECLIILL